MQSFLSTIDKSMAKNYVNEFEPIWFGEFFTPDIKAHVYATTNLMGEKRLRASPDYVNYFNAILNFSNSGMDPNKFEEWQGVLDKILNKSSKKE